MHPTAVDDLSTIIRLLFGTVFSSDAMGSICLLGTLQLFKNPIAKNVKALATRSIIGIRIFLREDFILGVGC